MEREAEIDQLNRDLALLGDRYAGYARSAKLMRMTVMALLALGAAAAFAFAVKLFLFDVLYGAFFVGAVIICAGAAIWFVPSLGLRWIDFVSQYPRGIYSPYFFSPDIDPRRRARSDAELIEWQIADRERRLKELELSALGNHTSH